MREQFFALETIPGYILQVGGYPSREVAEAEAPAALEVLREFVQQEA